MLGVLKRKSIVRVTIFALLLAMAAWAIPVNMREADAATASLKNPRIATDETVTWDCVWFGHYPQTSDGNGGFNNAPIKWRVLSVDGNEALLLADTNLEVRPYDNNRNGKWENSDIRDWLNGSDPSSFLGKAFTDVEQEAIYEEMISTSDNSKYGTEGGNDTRDKVFLLSIDEACNPDYGFPSDYSDFSEARKTTTTWYAGHTTGISTTGWWLRSPGHYSYDAAGVTDGGCVSLGGDHVYGYYFAVRPALRLNLSSNLWSYAGTVSSDGKVDETGGTPGEPTEPDTSTITMSDISRSAEAGTNYTIQAKLTLAKGSNINPDTDLTWSSSDESVLKFIESGSKRVKDLLSDDIWYYDLTAKFEARKAGTVTVTVDGGGASASCKVTVTQSDAIPEASIFTNAEWKQWLQTSESMLNYLTEVKNYLHVMYISRNDNSVFGRFEYLFTNAIKLGEGWRELLNEDTTRADAEQILCAMLEESDSSVQGLAAAKTVNNIASTLSYTLKNYVLSEGYDTYTTSELASWMSKDSFKSTLSKKGLDGAMDLLLETAEPDTAKKLEKTFEQFKVSEELSKGLEHLGVGLQVLDLTKASFDTYMRYLQMKEASDFYYDALKYVEQNAKIQAVCQAAENLYERGKMNEAEAMADITKQIALEKGTDEAISQLFNKTYALKAIKTGLSAGNLLSNLFFHTQDVAKLKSSMRVSSYIGESLAEWTRKNYDAAKRNLSFNDAEATMYGMALLTKVRKLGEISLKNCAPHLNDRRAEELACRVISTLDSQLEHLAIIEKENMQLLKVACPVDVEVYDKNNRLVTTVYDGKEDSGTAGDVRYSVYYSRTEDDYIKIILTPAGKGYTYKVKGKGLGKVSCALSSIGKDGLVQEVSTDSISIDADKTFLIKPADQMEKTVIQMTEGETVTEEKPFTENNLQTSVPVTGITANSPGEAAIRVGEQILLDYQVKPENASNKQIEWTSSNAKMAAVNHDGVVTGVSAGTAVITAETADGGFKQTCKITVRSAQNPTEPPTTPTSLRKPRFNGETVTWDCVWFGHYPQSKNRNGGYNNDPIKWRVLSVNGNEALLLADKNLDCKKYNEKDTSVTWETSTIRSWLNGNNSDSFLGKAFTGAEQGVIYKKIIQNRNNPKYGTAGGNTTKDKVFLLSIDEVTNPAYGFPKDYNAYSKTRRAVNTAYAANRSSYMHSEGNTAWWWLRSPGSKTRDAADVDNDGYVYCDGLYVDNDYGTVRPALRLNLSSNLWSYAGTVSAVYKEIKTGNVIQDRKSNASYIITKTGKGANKNTVTYKKPRNNKKTNIAIPATVKIAGKAYRVTKIANNAFKGNSKIKSVKIGANIQTIGANAFNKCTKLTSITIPNKVTTIQKGAFANCKNLKNITIKTTKLTKKSVGKNAFKGTAAKAKVKTPKGKAKTYKTLLQSKGLNKKVTVK